MDLVNYFKRCGIALILALALVLTGCAGSATTSSESGQTTSTTKAEWVTVQPTLSAEESAHQINNSTPYLPAKVETEYTTIYNPVAGWSYSHHASITYFKGKLYAMFSNGHADEDDCGQRVMLSTSTDFHTWSEPKPLVDSTMGKNSELVLLPLGFHIYNDTLIAYYGGSEYSASSLRAPNKRPLADAVKVDTRKMYAIQTSDGENWKSASISCPFTGNFGPIATKSGRLLMCGAGIHPYTDDPSGLGLWNFGMIDTSNAASRGAEIITEGSFYQTADGILHMLLRTNSKYLFASESYDDGKSWTEPYPTQFTDCGSKFRFGQLPDGRYFSVGNPVPRSDRTPLVLSTSSDGINFDKWYILRDEPYTQQFEGLYKGGVYGYPNVVIQDDYMYVIYSKRKEAIEVTRVALSSLDKVQFEADARKTTSP